VLPSAALLYGPFAADWGVRHQGGFVTDAIRELQSRRIGDVEIGMLLYYTAELSRTTRLGLYLYENIHSLTSNWGETSIVSDPENQLARELELFGYIEGFLTAYARSSMLLFPPKKGGFARKRGAALREFLQIRDDHPIGTRTLRDDWMHLDERLDNVVQDPRGRGGWGFMVLRDASLASNGFRETFMRLVDPTTEEIFFLGRSYSLTDLAQHVRSVRAAIDPALSTIAPVDA
jgi:hypothetical protein